MTPARYGNSVSNPILHIRIPIMDFVQNTESDTTAPSSYRLTGT